MFCEFVTMATMTSYLKIFPGTSCKTLIFEFSAKFPVRYNLQTFWPRSGHFWPLSSRTSIDTSHIGKTTTDMWWRYYICGCGLRRRCPTEGDSTWDQMATVWARQQMTDRCRACWLAHHCDSIRISTECPDVLTDPLESGGLIPQSIVSGRCIVICAKKRKWRNVNKCNVV